jgi:hypothetical protein
MAFTDASLVALRVFREVAALRHTHPAIIVTTRDGGTPALVRALRAGTLDLALLASAPPFRPRLDWPSFTCRRRLRHHNRERSARRLTRCSRAP